MSNRAHRVICLAELSSGQFHAPPREIRERRLADQRREVARQRRTRDAALMRQPIDRPIDSWIGVQHRQRARNSRIAKGQEPRSSAIVLARNPRTNDVPEQHVDQAVDDDRGSRGRRRELMVQQL